MNIETVKITTYGYLLNGGISVPDVSSNRHCRMIQEWIAEGNTPESADLPTITTDMVKEEAQRRILAVYPDWKQLNYLRQQGNNPTQEDLNVINLAWAYIDNIRAKSNILEGTLPQDYQDNTHWA